MPAWRAGYLATSLARKYFNAAIPDAVITAERGDTAIAPMVRRIVDHWQADPSGLSAGPKLADPGDKLVDMD